MRDKNDPGTLDMHPAKRGRPCLNAESGPLSPAERARRYRALRRAKVGRIAAQATRVLDRESEDYPRARLDIDDALLVDAIKRELAFLGRLFDSRKGRGAGASRKRLGAMAAELARRYPER